MPDGDREVRVPLLPWQAEFVRDRTSKILGAVAGMGAGKSKALACKALDVGSINAPCPYLFVEPTFALVRDIAVRTFLDLCEEKEIPHNFHKTDHILEIGRGSSSFPIFLRSGDKPERIIGINAGAGAIDEPGQMPVEVGKRVLQRIRDPRAKVRQLALGGTPEGFGWLYDWLVANPSDGTRLIRARTTDNWHLPKEYVDGLLGRLSEEERAAYIEGEFVNLFGGTVYREFRRTTHAKPCARPLEGETVVGMDFNTSTMAAVVARCFSDEGHFWGEVVRHNTNTFEQADALIDFLQDAHAKHTGSRPTREEVARTTTIHCDATGSANKTSAHESDVAILRRAGFKVVKPAANPRIKDRVATVNHRFRMKRLFVDPEGCPTLVRALEQQIFAPDGMPDKTAGHDHITDAAGYLCTMRPGWKITAAGGNQGVHHFH